MKTENAKWYCRADWRTKRAQIIRRDPVCVICQRAASTEVDHIIPRLVDRSLELDDSNLRGLCASCHSTVTKQYHLQIGTQTKCRSAIGATN